jgi:hypothetical protein
MMMETEINTAIVERALAGEWLTEAELTELDSVDVLSLGMLADEVRRARVGREVTYTRVLEVHASTDVATLAERIAQADEVRLVEPGRSIDETARLVAEVREAVGAGARVTGFSLAGLREAGWGSLGAILATLQRAGLQAVVEAPVDLLTPAEAQAGIDLGLGIDALSVQRPFEGGRVALVMRLREFLADRPGGIAVAPLAREQSVTAPTTGYHDVRLVALARLALPRTRVIEVDWQQYGPKLAQVALTFGANHLNRVSIEDDASLGRRRSHVEDVRRNITAAGFTPVGQVASR